MLCLSLGEEPQFCAQVEQNYASHIYIDSGDMLTNLVNAYTGGATNMPDVAGGDVEVTLLAKTIEQGASAPEKPAGRRELCPFCCEELPKNGLNISTTAKGTRLRLSISARTVG